MYTRQLKLCSREKLVISVLPTLRMTVKVLNDVFNYLGADFTTLSIVIIVCVLLHRLLSEKRFNPPLPPLPAFALPVIGHFHLLDQDRRKVFRKYRRQLGDVYRLQFGGKLVVVISGYESLKEAFVKQEEKFSSRPSLHLTDQLQRKAGVVMTVGSVWKEHRRFCLSKLKEFGMGKSIIEKTIHDEVNTLLTSFRAHSGKPFNPKTHISTHVTNIISSMVFKGHFTHGDDRILKMIAMIDENVHSKALAANFLPWLQRLPGDPLKVKNLIQNSDYIFEYAFEIIADHEKEYNESDVDDLTSAYIHELRRLNNADEPTTMNYKQLAGTIVDLFIAGSHTSATAIGWAIPCLVSFPRVQEKLFNEVTSVIGTDRLPSVQDKTRLVYLEAFYLEVLRYCDIGIASAPHATTHDLTFKEFTIPKDAIILPDLDSVLSDENIWGDPDIFRPERFIDDDGNIRKKDAMIVFFFGKRSCIGESLARMELLIFLGALIQNFKFESCPGESLTVENVDGVFGFLHAPKPYEVLVTSR